ncbi:MAG: hypothetical protein KKF50_05450 [Nanoarchaeota archaeon]|nr:hypothetical protein [Nanoarchaeota archaeon]
MQQYRKTIYILAVIAIITLGLTIAEKYFEFNIPWFVRVILASTILTLTTKTIYEKWFKK